MGDLTCEWCDRTFTQPNAMGPTPKFCSASHRQRAYEIRRAEALIRDLTTERDRLRTIVDALVGFRAKQDAAIAADTEPEVEIGLTDVAFDAWRAVTELLDQLDGSEATDG